MSFELRICRCGSNSQLATRNSKKMKIYLIGFMGSGKSHVGRQLSRQMNLPFIDLDDYLEAKAGRSISNIFATEGEAAFRKLEQDCIQELSQASSAVIATGGGTPCFFDNMKCMKTTGLTVYLKTPVSILAERLQAETAHRPLLAGKTEAELVDFIEGKLAERAAYYEAASVVFEIREREEDVCGILFRLLLDA